MKHMNLINKVCNFFQGLPSNFNRDKKALIDFVFEQCEPKPASFADLGGVWNVNGAYSFYALQKESVNKGFLVDTDFTEAVRQKAEAHPELELIQDNFGNSSLPERLGDVDAIFLFDVLLHQVKPDWDEILENYASRTKYFVILNQQWTGSDSTVRLVDLGKEEYLKNVPHIKDHPLYINLFEKMYEEHPQHKRIWKDIHNVWQWGITDRDLVGKMESLGFEMKYFKNCGQFCSLSNFEDHAFLFQKI